MYLLSSQAQLALGYGPSFRTKCTITPPGGVETTLQLMAGSVSVDSQSRIRRQMQQVDIRGGAAVFELLQTPGAVLRAWQGIKFRSQVDPEWIPVFTGEVSAPRQSIGGGTISLTGLDLANWLSRTTYDTPWVIAPGTSRVTAIIAALLDARPGTAYDISKATDTGVVATQTIFTTGPLDLIAELTKAGNTEGFFGPDGTFILRDLPSPSSLPVWSVSAGPGGTLKSADRTLTTDKRFNKVIVEPTSRDGSQQWATLPFAEITDTTHPLHKSKIGKATKKVQSAIATFAEGQALANRLLAIGTNGRAESLQLGAIMNPALEGYDVIRANTPRVNTDSARLYQHFIDTLTLDLLAHTMTLGTLSQVVTE